MLKNFFSISKSQVAVLTTLVVLIMLASCYFFIYLPNNEKILQAQRFRALQNIDRNIHAKIENSVALLNNLLSDFQNGNPEKKETLKKYIEDYPKKNFTLLQPDSIPSEQWTAAKDSMDSSYSIAVNNNSKQITLLLAKQKVAGKNTFSFQQAMIFSFEQFTRFLLPENVFDEYIIFSGNKPVFETFPSGISYIVKDSLVNSKTGINSSIVINQNISGTDYKLFLQSVSLTSGSEWVIGGLLNNQRYQHEKNQLPTTVILLLVTILLIITVTFPLIKLYQMGSKDRLTITDGIAAIFISMLLMSLLFFIFFKYNLPARGGETNNPEEELATSISKGFSDEIDAAYRTITAINTLMENSRTLKKKDLVYLGEKKMAFSEKRNLLNDTLKNEIAAICNGLKINQAFWLDSTGFEHTNWTAEGANGPHGKYHNREYFKNIINERHYFAGNDTAKKYYLDQVTSWTSGSFTSVVSVPSYLTDIDDPKKNHRAVAALSLNMQSLDAAILPAGYLFAIIDRQGKVLYHSERTKNLNENLLYELSAAENLQSCIQAKTAGNFSTNYFGKKYNALVKPLNELPYFIVILQDTTFEETRDTEIYSFTISMLLLFFGFLVLQLVGVFLVSARQSFFKNQLFDTSWIGPKISCQQEYVLSAVFNLITIAALFVTFTQTTFLQYFFIMLFAVTFMPFFLTGIFAIRYYRQKRHVLQYKKTALLSLGILILFINWAAFRLLSEGHYFFVVLYQIALIALSLILYYFKEKVWTAGRWLQAKTGPLKKWNYINSFALMGLTRLVATSGIPIVFFYYSAYNYEQDLSIRYRHIDFLSKLNDKKPAIAEDTSLKPVSYPGVYPDSSSITEITVIDRKKDSVIFKNRYHRAYTAEDSTTIGLLKLFRLDVTDMAVAEDKFYTHQAADSSFYFNHLLNPANANSGGNLTCLQTSQPGKYLQATSADLNYRFPALWKKGYILKGILFWGLLLVSLVTFYFLVCSVIKKLFALHLPDLSGWKELDNKILTDEKLNQLVFVIGLPGAGKKYHIINKIITGEIKDDEQRKPYIYDETDETNNNVFIADLIHIPDSSNDTGENARWDDYVEKIFAKKNRLILVNHFEYNIQDPLTNRIKLNFLERLMLEDNCKIIILSTIHPVAFLDSVISQPLKTANANDEPVPGQDLERWHVLLGHYRIVLLPLDLVIQSEKISDHQTTITGQVRNTDNKPLSNATVMVKNTDKIVVSDSGGRFTMVTNYQLPLTLVINADGYVREDIAISKNNETVTVVMDEGFYNWKDKIRAETHYTHFLHRMQQAAIKVTIPLSQEQRMAKSDELAFKLQVTSHYFYMYIWQSLTKEEKFLLYDLAEDNLVNPYDSYNLCMLIGKGVIIPTDGTLKLFNKGFRNFILTAIGNTEAMKIKNQIKDNGNWNKLKNPLLLVILAILAFLLTSQEESYSKIITYLAALGAGVPTVLKIFSIFEKQSDKTN